VTTLPPAFYLQDTLRVAQELIGCYLLRLRPDRYQSSSEGDAIELDPRAVEAGGRIVETEAYLPDDPASHSYGGPTPRARVMFERGGIAYVYLIYGMHHCFNVVTGPDDHGSAVLIRAIEPLWGLETMEQRRARRPRDEDRRDPAGSSPALTNGPAKLAQALGIRRERDNGKSLSASDLLIVGIQGEASRTNGYRVGQRTRVGLSKATEKPWRFVAEESRFLSRR
jgi:DNA-3-methyladenine glycosylase